MEGTQDSRHVHLEFSGDEFDQLEEIRAVKEELGMTWKRMLYMAALVLSSEYSDDESLDDLKLRLGEAILEHSNHGPLPQPIENEC